MLASHSAASVQSRRQIMDRAVMPARRLEVVEEGHEPLQGGLRCARPSCGQEVVRSAGRGAPAKYCSTACRRLAKKEHDEAVGNLRVAINAALQFNRRVPADLAQRLLAPVIARVIHRAEALVDAGPGVSADALREALADLLQVLGAGGDG